jgi:hypothetical protein
MLTDICVPSGKVDLLLDTNSKLMRIFDLGFLLLTRRRLGGGGTDRLRLEGGKINDLYFRIRGLESGEVLGDVCAVEEDGCSEAEARTAKRSEEEEMAESSTVITLGNRSALIERGETAVVQPISSWLPKSCNKTTRTRILIQGEELLDQVVSCESELLLVEPLAQG